jgi:phage/conjugal plasmid C-4 type zinc finger TraR family protein
MHYHYLTIEQRESIDQLIRTRIDTLRGAIGEALRQSGSTEAIGLANHLEEIDDDAVADVERVLDAALLERELTELRALESAAKRLHTPEYGVCADCGGDIPFARLKANPSAERCLACQARFERSHPGGATPRF